MSFINELKRRNVVKVAVAYAVIAWLLIQVIDIVFPRLGVPEWAISALMVTLILGFPVVVVVTWAFQITSEGIKTQQAADDANLEGKSSNLNGILIGTLVLALSYVVFDAYVLTESDDPVSQIVDEITEASGGSQFAGEITVTSDTSIEKSIAVLPFTNLSNDPDQDYFSDGLTEEMIATLSVVDGLLVTGRTSAFFFKGSEESPAQIANSLGVDHILQGSVRKAGDQLRITTTLMDAGNGFNLWTETFDRELLDIFSIQDEIATAVATALSVTLGAGEFDRPGMTRNAQAYDAYLRGQAVWEEQGFVPEQAAALYQEAVALDPDFGLAWVRLGEVYTIATYDLTAEEGRDFRDLRNEAFSKAREVAPDMPELRMVAALELRGTWDWQQAEAIYQQLIADYGTSSSLANQAYGLFLSTVGRTEDALPYLQRARRLDPLNANLAIRMSAILRYLDRLDEAVEEANRGLALDNNAGAAPFLRGEKIMAAWGRNDLGEAVRLASDNQEWNTTLGRVGTSTLTPISLMQRLEEGDRESVLDDMRQILALGLSPIFNLAIAPLAALAGDPELALQYQGFEANPNIPDVFGTQPIWGGYYGEMRQLEDFKEMVREVGLLDYWRSTGNWGDFCQPLEGSDDFECF